MLAQASTHEHRRMQDEARRCSWILACARMTLYRGRPPTLVMAAQAGTHEHRRSKMRLGGVLGSREFANEVQHQLTVLPWDASTTSSRSTTGAPLPAFTPKAARSARSLQIWIARHRRSLAS